MGDLRSGKINYCPRTRTVSYSSPRSKHTSPSKHIKPSIHRLGNKQRAISDPTKKDIIKPPTNNILLSPPNMDIKDSHSVVSNYDEEPNIIYHEPNIYPSDTNTNISVDTESEQKYDVDGDVDHKYDEQKKQTLNEHKKKNLKLNDDDIYDEEKDDIFYEETKEDDMNVINMEPKYKHSSTQKKKKKKIPKSLKQRTRKIEQTQPEGMWETLWSLFGPPDAVCSCSVSCTK